MWNHHRVTAGTPQKIGGICSVGSMLLVGFPLSGSSPLVFWRGGLISPNTKTIVFFRGSCLRALKKINQGSHSKFQTYDSPFFLLITITKARKKTPGWSPVQLGVKNTVVRCKPIDNVDGRNPAPTVMYKTLWILGYVPDELVQDFFHQPYFSHGCPDHPVYIYLEYKLTVANTDRIWNHWFQIQLVVQPTYVETYICKSNLE